MRPLLVAAAALAALLCCLVAALLVLTFGRPPQPLPLGTVQWMDEAGVTVDRVDRLAAIDGIKARGEFYLVHVRVLAPYGLRPIWRDSDAEVVTFALSGATQPPGRYEVDEPVQALLDRRDGRPGPVHEVLGASERDDVVFDLPRNVEQPALIVAPANDPLGILSWAFGQFWQPHRFNLRYD